MKIEIDENLFEEIKDFIELNKLTLSPEKYINNLIKSGFTKEKYGNPITIKPKPQLVQSEIVKIEEKQLKEETAQHDNSTSSETYDLYGEQ